MKKFKFSFAGIIFALLVSFVYIGNTTAIFESKSEVLILRTKLETPFKVQEESRNRWIWLRDGLSLQQNILDESLALKIQDQVEPQKGQAFDLAALRKKVEVSYTGADEFLFKIKVADANKEAALKINQLVFDRLKELYLDQPQQIFEDSLAAYTEEYPQNMRDKSFEATIAQLKALHAWEQSQRQASFQVLLNPMISQEPIWPKKSALMVVGFLLGLLLGLSLDMLTLNAKKRD